MLGRKIIIRCKICKSKTYEIVSKAQTFHRCRKCQFISKDPSHYLSQQEEFKRYKLHENYIEDKSYQRYFINFLENSVLPFITMGQALDFGSGPEPVLGYVMETYYDFEVDNYDLYFQPNQIYEGKEYDLITSTEVVEHLKEPLSVFGLFKEHLKKGGYLSIMTQFYPENLKDFQNWYYILDPTHISLYNLQTFKNLGELFDLQILYEDQIKMITFKNN